MNPEIIKSQLELLISNGYCCTNSNLVQEQGKSDMTLTLTFSMDQDTNTTAVIYQTSHVANSYQCTDDLKVPEEPKKVIQQASSDALSSELCMDIKRIKPNEITHEQIQRGPRNDEKMDVQERDDDYLDRIQQNKKNTRRIDYPIDHGAPNLEDFHDYDLLQNEECVKSTEQRQLKKRKRKKERQMGDEKERQQKGDIQEKTAGTDRLTKENELVLNKDELQKTFTELNAGELSRQISIRRGRELGEKLGLNNAEIENHTLTHQAWIDPGGGIRAMLITWLQRQEDGEATVNAVVSILQELGIPKERYINIFKTKVTQ